MNGVPVDSTTFTYFLSGVPYWFCSSTQPKTFNNIQSAQSSINPIQFYISTIVTDYTQLNIDFGDKTTASFNIASNWINFLRRQSLIFHLEINWNFMSKVIIQEVFLDAVRMLQHINAIKAWTHIRHWWINLQLIRIINIFW